MKQVININFQGRVVPIEVTAFDKLKDYTESLSRHFAAEEGKEEIINDIENRIGELFQQRLKEGATCITDDDVNAVIRSMGRPEEFDAEQNTSAAEGSTYTSGTGAGTNETFISGLKTKRLYRDENDKVIGGVCSGLANYFGIDVVVVRIIFVVAAITFGFGIIPYLILWLVVPSSASTQIGSARKKLYRDNDDKIVGGVSSGIANYFGINPWIIRVLFILPFLGFVSGWGHWGGLDFPDFLRMGFSPGALIIYIILWLVIPEASTTAERLEMKGEKVDMNSIKNSVMEEMKGVQERAQKLGKEAKVIAQERGKAFGSDVSSVTKRGSRSLGDIIVFLIKIFAYFIIGCIAFAFVIALFAFGIAAIGLFPMKDFVLNDGWQNVFAWGTLLFFIAAPIIGIITWIIRRLAKIKSNRRMMRYSFLSLWLVGLVCFIGLITSVGRDFKSTNSLNEEEVVLVNPGINKLEVTTNSPERKFYRNRSFRFQPFYDIEEDTATVQNISVHIVKSPTDSFRVTMLKMVNGRSRRAADTLAGMINFNVRQQNSLLVMDKGIAITRQDKFRNQRIILTIYVPIGKQIRIDKSVGWSNDITFGPWDDNFDIDFDNVEHGWDVGVNYIMKEAGLFTVDGDEPADNWKSRNNKTKVEINERGLRITTDGSEDNYRYEDSSPPVKIDTIKLKQQLQQERIKDSLQKVKEKIESELKKIGNRESAGEPTALMNSFPAFNPLVIMN
ncbi:MAG: PspC domain-containing protein [Ferruginibacter sp.]